MNRRKKRAIKTLMAIRYSRNEATRYADKYRDAFGYNPPKRKEKRT